MLGEQRATAHRDGGHGGDNGTQRQLQLQIRIAPCRPHPLPSSVGPPPLPQPSALVASPYPLEGKLQIPSILIRW
jgi:hypothetical protein